jgi:Protein of unknown function (DUF2442)
MIHLIKAIEDVRPFTLTLRYNTGETLLVDLTNKLREWSRTPDSKFRQLLDPAYFVTVKLEPEFASIAWDNGIDLCPDVLYELGKPITISNPIQHQAIPA